MTMTATTEAASDADHKKKISVKCYVVLLKDNVALPGLPNVKVIAVKLTQQAAQLIVDGMPGSYIEKFFADKT